MEPQTNMANTQNWLVTSKGLKVRSYIEALMPTSTVSETLLPYEGLYNALREISLPLAVERVGVIDSQLDLDFKAWDILSDQALIDFERELD